MILCNVPYIKLTFFYSKCLSKDYQCELLELLISNFLLLLLVFLREREIFSMFWALDELNWFRLLLLLLWSRKNPNHPIRTEYSCSETSSNYIKGKGMITSLSLSLHVWILTLRHAKTLFSRVKAKSVLKVTSTFQTQPLQTMAKLR